MRRNLRLDWRALALLGALLSIIIDWPGLVYAMPTILPPVTATATANASPIDTLNTIKNDKTVSFLNDQQSEAHKRFATMTPSLKQDIEIVQRITTTNEKLKQQQQVNDNQNSIRKQQQIINKTQEQKTKHEEKFQIVTAIHNKVEEEENSSEIPLLAAKNQLESLPKVTSLLKNTHAKNSRNTNTENNTFKSTTTDATVTTTTTTTTSMLSTATTTTPPTTTESLVSIPSTLMPTNIVETEAQAPQQQQQKPFETSFKFSSSHHLAILSRTERSIRSSSSSSLLPSAFKSGGSSSNVSSSSGSHRNGASSMVRRSSDMSVLKSKRLNNSRNLHQKNNLDRNERSTVSHLSGPSRKIQLYIKNRFIQLLPDGTVNGTQDEQCDYTILQRSTVEVGRIKIQGVATCLYLCMDPCGAVYGSKEFTDDCVFNESMEQHNYNTYSSTYNSNTRRKYYLALNRHGEPRKLQIPPSRSLGKLATYTNAIPETVPQERVEQLIAKNFGANRVKHGIRQLCDTGKPLIELIDSKNFKARPKCNPNNSNSNSNNNSNSKNTLSRNLDKDNSLVSHNHHQQQHHHHTNSNNNNNNSNSNGQVPVANDKNLNTNSRSSSSSSSSNSNSNSSSSKTETNRDNNSSPSSISISQNNGHISNSNLSNSRHTSSSSNNSSDSLTSNINSSISVSSTPHNNSLHRGGKKAGKKRKCRRFENEEQHNCTTPLNRPTAFTKRGNQLGPLRQQKCQNLLLQQQQAGVSEIILPPMCTKKGGAKNKHQQAHKRAQGKNSLGIDGMGPNNRRGKKLNMNRAGNAGSRQAAKNQQQGTGASNNSSKKKQNKNSKKGGGNNNNNSNKKNKKSNSNSSSTTEKTESTSTLKTKLWETTSLVPSTTIYDNYDPHGETTSDRGEREQRNVRYSNSMEESMEQSSEDTSANEDPDDDDNDMESNDENNNEDASYEDDSYISSSSHMPYAAAESSHTPLTAGAEDFLYYDQLDFIPMGLWKFIAILWLLAWSHRLLS